MLGQYKNATIISYVTIAINIISGLFYTPWILQMIGESDYGLYTVATTFISLFLIDFGVRSSVSRYVAMYVTQGEEHKKKVFLGVVLKLYIVIDIIISLVLLFVFFHLGEIYREFNQIELSRFKIVFIIIAAYSVIQFPLTNVDGILYAYEKLTFLKACELIQKIACIFATIIVLLNGGGLFGLVLVNTLSSLSINVFKIIYLSDKKILRFKFEKISTSFFKEILSFSLWSTVVSIAQRLITSIMPTVVAMELGTADVPAYSFASLLEGYVYIIGSAVNGFFISKLTRLNEQKNTSEINKLFVEVGRIMVCVIGTVVFGFICFGDIFVIEFWLSKEFAVVYPMAILLMIGNILSIPQQVADTLLIVQNRIRFKAKVMIIMGIINVMLAFILVKVIGAIGVCLSICITNILIYIINNIYYKKRMNLDTIKYFSSAFLPYVIIMAITTIVIKYLPVINKEFIYRVLVFGLGFLIGICFSFSKEMLVFIKRLKRRFAK